VISRSNTVNGERRVAGLGERLANLRLAAPGPLGEQALEKLV